MDGQLIYDIQKGTLAHGSPTASNRLMKELKDIFKSEHFKNGKYGHEALLNSEKKMFSCNFDVKECTTWKL